MPLFLAPVAPGSCPVCATEHADDEPHNLQSLYYGARFKMTHRADPTWADALAHCDDVTREAWEAELRKRGAWTEPADRDPIAEPPGAVDPAAPVTSDEGVTVIEFGSDPAKPCPTCGGAETVPKAWTRGEREPCPGCAQRRVEADERRAA